MPKIWPYFRVKLSCVCHIHLEFKEKKRKGYIELEVTYSYPKMTCSYLKKVTNRTPKVT